jgi:Domain of unknown function (DUF4340)
MKTEYKIYAALVILALIAMGVYFSKQSKAKQAEEHSATAASADLPSIAVPKDDIEKITKLEIHNPGKDKDGSKPSDVTLEKKGDAWEVTKPVQAKANAANVRSLLDNFKDLKVKESIDKTANNYKQYDLTEDKAVHVLAFKGSDKVADLYFGKSGSRGQMARTDKHEGVYVAGGFSSFLYTREVKNWRETQILKFEDANVIQAEVVNKNGDFSFSKNGDKWSGSLQKRDKEGKLEKAEKEWKKFDEGKVKDLLRAYKGLNAEDFADDKADTGLDKADENGGVVKIKLKDNAGDYTIKVGKTSKGSSRFAVKDPGDGTVYVVSSWAADWATGDKTKFEKGDDKKKDKKDEGHDEPPMPPMPEEE